MNQSFLNQLIDTHQRCSDCPKYEDINKFFNKLLGLLFPIFSSQSIKDVEILKVGFDQLRSRFRLLLNGQTAMNKEELIADFFASIPDIYALLQKDIDAIFAGDPAAKNKDEVVRTYPGFYAIAAHRFAHKLYQMNIDVLPRAITEHAHSITGIDIHPGATIGECFCIDHGTGVVIGETTVIGNHVKIYQGVTLGALSVEKDLANTKRHPTIEDDVVIYAGATILGGKTTVGASSVIGGNVWITKSVPTRAKVYYQAKIDANGQQVASDHALINETEK